MYPIDNNTASTTLPVPKPVGVPGFFTAGTVGGVAATIVEADWLNQVQQELLAILAAASITPSKTTSSQVIQAILWLIQNNTRQRLTGPLSLYVSPSGNDANNGLSPSTAFRSLQAAWNFIMEGIDLGHQPVTVNVAPGSYSPCICSGAPVGAQSQTTGISFVGDVNNPDNVLIDAPNAIGFLVSYGASVFLSGMKLQASGLSVDFNLHGTGIATAEGGFCAFAHVDFGTCGTAHMACMGFSGLTSGGQPYTISGNAPVHAQSSYSGADLTLSDSTVTINNNPAFSTAFLQAVLGSSQANYNMVFNGAATGVRAIAETNAVIFLNGANPNTYLPGSQPAVTNTGGLIA
jgi:hypothetical protein